MYLCGSFQHCVLLIKPVQQQKSKKKCRCTLETHVTWYKFWSSITSHIEGSQDVIFYQTLNIKHEGPHVLNSRSLGTKKGWWWLRTRIARCHCGWGRFCCRTHRRTSRQSHICRLEWPRIRVQSPTGICTPSDGVARAATLAMIVWVSQLRPTAASCSRAAVASVSSLGWCWWWWHDWPW